MADLKKIKEKLSTLPMCPGVYIMKDSEGNVLYVGKSKVLKNRVSQYFQSSANHSPKTRSMVERVADFEYILTDTEAEALALECNLIKENRPKYNILLKDDKQYPYIKITINEPFPRIFITRNLKRDGSLYFGPYMNTLLVREALEEIRKIFKIRSCKKNFLMGNKNGRPCLYHHIGQCSAPCTGKMGEEEYKETIKQVIAILNGNEKPIVKELRKKMQAASDEMQFEKAAIYRDRINGIMTLAEKQKITSTKNDSRDIIGIFEEKGDYCIQLFYYRNGKTVKAEHFTFTDDEGKKREILESFVKQFYFTADNIPAEIHVPEELEEATEISEWLSEKSGHKVSIVVPKRGEKLKMLEMVVMNARESLYKYNFEKDRSEIKQNRILSDLKKLLNLDETPFRIECYDISNISGKSSVGVEVVFVNTLPQNKLYRKFNIKSVDGANDYESMREVVYRRISEGYKEEDLIKEGKLDPEKAKFLPFPNLILLDGGRGHVQAIRELFDTLGETIPIFGLVKDDFHKTRGITDENQEFYIEKKSELFRFLSAVQEEVHRFAISAHRKKHEKATFKSELENISGVGSATRKKLLENFLSIKAIKNADIDDLATVVNKKTAKAVYEYFHKENKNERDN